MTGSDQAACLSSEPAGLRAPVSLVDFVDLQISRDEGNSAKGSKERVLSLIL